MSNSSSNSLIAKNTIILNIRLIFVLVINLIISRQLLQSLGVTDYGLYTLVGGFVSLLTILTSSITGTAQRFITYELGRGDSDKLANTFSNILNAIYIIAAIIILIGIILGIVFIKDYLNLPPEKSSAAVFVYYCSLLTFVLNLIAVPYVALINAHEHMHCYAIVSIIDAFFKLIIVLCLFFFNDNRVVIYALLLTLVTAVDLILYHTYDIRKFAESKYKKGIDKAIIKKMFSFSVWMGLGSAAGIIKDQGGNILINLFFGLTLNASMGIANQIRGLLGQFANNIGIAIAPQITKSYAEGDLDRSIKLTFFRSKCQGLFILLVSIPIIIYTDEILHLWLGIVPDYAVVFARQMCFICILNSMAQGFGPLFLAIGDIKGYQLFGSVVLLFYIPFTYVALKVTNDPCFCLLFNVLFELFFVFANFYVLKNKVKFPYLRFVREVIARIAICFVVVSFLSVGLKKLMVWDSGLLNILINCIISTCIFVGVAYLLVLDKEEKYKICQFVLKNELHERK